VRDVRLFFEVFGQEWVFSGETLRRRPVLLGLHGGPGVDGTGLRYALAPLAEVAQVIVPDQRGHGRSEGGTPASWNLPHWAADVEGFCEALGVAAASPPWPLVRRVRGAAVRLLLSRRARRTDPDQHGTAVSSARGPARARP